MLSLHGDFKGLTILKQLITGMECEQDWPSEPEVSRDVLACVGIYVLPTGS